MKSCVLCFYLRVCVCGVGGGGGGGAFLTVISFVHLCCWSALQSFKHISMLCNSAITLWIWNLKLSQVDIQALCVEVVMKITISFLPFLFFSFSQRLLHRPSSLRFFLEATSWRVITLAWSFRTCKWTGYVHRQLWFLFPVWNGCMNIQELTCKLIKHDS